MIKVKDLLLSCANTEVKYVRVYNHNYDCNFSNFNYAIDKMGDKTVIVFCIINETINILVSKND